jgi:hypothetical protein
LQFKTQRDRTDSQSSTQQSPGTKGSFALQIPESENRLNQSPTLSPIITSGISSDDNDSRSDGKFNKGMRISRGSRKNKHVPDIESLPEGVPLESKSRKLPPSPLIIQQRVIVKCDMIYLMIHNFFNFRILVNQMVSRVHLQFT